MAAIHGGETPGGFALPLDAGLRRILEVLKRGEEVEYGFLGVSFPEQRLEPGQGVRLEVVHPGSPADLAKLQPHDVVLAVDGVPIQENDDLFLQLATHLAGTKVKLKLMRGFSNEISTVDVTLGKFYVPGRSIASSLGKRPYFRGLRVDYTTLLAQQGSRLYHIPQGVMVSDIQPGSKAALAQLKTGEVITRVNNRPVRAPAEFYEAVAGLTGPIELHLYSAGPREPAVKVVLK
jgi:serine protease Do